MDLKLLERATTGLERNLDIVHEALDYVHDLDDAIFGEFKTCLGYIDSALVAYFYFDADADRFERFILDLKQRYARSGLGEDPSILLPSFHEEADRILKAFDVNLNLLCRMLELDPPAPDRIDAEEDGCPSAVRWGNNQERNLIQTRNIIQVARGLLDE